MSSELIEDEVFLEMLVAFVDREDGRDPPLTPAAEAMVRRLIVEDPAVCALANDLRATNAALDRMLDDVSRVEVPEGLITMIRDYR